MTTIIGCDWAAPDNNSAPHLVAAKQAGARFALVRGTYGRGGIHRGCDIDMTWMRDMQAIVAAGLKRGAYTFLCFPQKDASMVTPSPEDQMDAFADYVHLTSFHDLPPFVDVEEASALAPADYYAWVVRAVNRLRERYGCWPGIYTSARVWAEYAGDHEASELRDCPLWIAKPWPLEPRSPVMLTGAPAYSPQVPAAFGEGNWWLYQYQGDALKWPGFTSTVDASRFNEVGFGARGAIVSWLQRRLGVADGGVFDASTEAAVKLLQSTYGLAPDGVVGPDTFAAAAWHA